MVQVGGVGWELGQLMFFVATFFPRVENATGSGDVNLRARCRQSENLSEIPAGRFQLLTPTTPPPLSIYFFCIVLQAQAGPGVREASCSWRSGSAPLATPLCPLVKGH